MKLNAVIRGFFILVVLVYPLLVYTGIQSVPPSLFGLLLVVLLAMRFGVLRPEERKLHLPLLILLGSFAVLATLLQSQQFLLYYPVVVNGVMFAVFAISLRGKESILLRLVQARGVSISVYGPNYLNRLTLVWAGFFLINAMVAAWTVTRSLQIWTLYNGLIAYLLAALLMVMEWLFRIQYKKRKGVWRA